MECDLGRGEGKRSRGACSPQLSPLEYACLENLGPGLGFGCAGFLYHCYPPPGLGKGNWLPVPPLSPPLIHRSLQPLRPHPAHFHKEGSLWVLGCQMHFAVLPLSVQLSLAGGLSAIEELCCPKPQEGRAPSSAGRQGPWPLSPKPPGKTEMGDPYLPLLVQTHPTPCLTSSALMSK